MLETTPDYISPYAHACDKLVAQLELDKDVAAELIRVELGLRLWEQLELMQQPVTGLAALLTGQPFPGLQKYSPEQKRALLVVLHLLQYGQYAWKAALREYMSHSASIRTYRVSPEFLLRREPDNAYERIESLNAILQTQLTLRDYTASQINNRFTMADAPTIRFKHPTLEHWVSATIPPALYKVAAQAVKTSEHLPPLGRKRAPIRATRAQLEATAQWLERRENTLGLKHENWVKRLNEIVRYHTYDPRTHTLGPANTEDVFIDGLLHVAGIVGGGKSTLAKLLAVLGSNPLPSLEETVDSFFENANASRRWRTVLVVGDNTTALEWANWFNRLLATDRNTPVATVTFGHSGRADNLDKLARIGDLEHWGHRWLDPGCVLQGRVTSLEELLEVLPVGQEPCEYVEQPGERRAWVPRVCPLWAICPSRQMYRDIPTTSIWITTVAALMQSRLPSQLDGRRLYVSELVYHYADLVIFDEIDHDQQWVDDLYAPQAAMIDQRLGQPGQGSGLVPTLDRNNAAWMDTPQRTVTHQRLQWAATLEGLLTHYVCTLFEQEPILQDFASKMGYFTAPVLFSELSREIVIATGKLTSRADRTAESPETYQKLADFLGNFHLDNRYLDPPLDADTVLEQELYRITQAMTAAADTLWRGDYIHQLCKRWLQHAADEFSLGEIPDEELIGLARKFELSLAVSLLAAYHYATHNRLVDLPEGFEKLQSAPPPFLRILPDAPLGVAYGFRYGVNTSEKAADAPASVLPPRKLESFRYEAVGRAHLLHLPYLLEPLGYDGPNVLAMSGTSWVQYSAGHHFAVMPGAVLAPNIMTQQALRESRFIFHPVYDPERDHRAVQISGSGQIDQQMVRAIELLALHPKPERSDLRRLIIQRLEENTQRDPERWKDRQRILVFTNSYRQAESCAKRIGGAYPDWTVLYLQRGDVEDPSNWGHVYGTQPYPRATIEAFGQHSNRTLLFAPLLTVGRRYNILNLSRVAAFGAVIFTVRPMSPPAQQSEAVHWLNYRVLEIYNDPTHHIWQKPTYEAQLTALRQLMLHEWFAVSVQRRGFGKRNDKRFNDDTAATMIATIVQACGRLLRGGVPFDAYFIDAAWAPHTAARSGSDTVHTSLLLHMNRLLEEYCRDPLGQALFTVFQQPFMAMTQSLTVTNEDTVDSFFDSDYPDSGDA